MQIQKSIQQIFVDRFTEEILLVIKARNEIREAEKREEERRKKAVDIEKLKKRFAEYLRTAKEEDIKKAREPVVRQEAPKIEEKHEEVKPAVVKVQEEKPRLMPPPQFKPLPALTPQKKEIPVERIEIPKNIPQAAQGEIDFGKIVFFVRDPLVTYIECPGEEKNIIIKKAGKIVRTQVTLSKEEIKTTVISFSQRVRIPLVEGILRARFQNLEISAVVSDVISPSFIIKKDIIPPMQRPETVLMTPRMPIAPAVASQQRIMPPIQRPFSAPGTSAPAQIPTAAIAQAPQQIPAPMSIPQASIQENIIPPASAEVAPVQNKELPALQQEAASAESEMKPSIASKQYKPLNQQ